MKPETVIQCPELLTFFFADDYRRYRYAYGGRSSGKSWTAAQGLIVRAIRSKIRILCCREIQNSIKQSVKKTIESNIERLGFSQYFTSTRESIVGYNGSEFIFQGLRSNVEQIKSLEDITIAYVEEAETVTKESWDVLIPTIRAPRSEIWLCFNPREPSDYTYQYFVTDAPRNSVSAFINFVDNPFCPEVMKEEAAALKAKDLGEYNHIWMGQCRQENRNALWQRKSMIDPYRVGNIDPAELDRIVVAVDPAATSGRDADETGIVVVGEKRSMDPGGESHFYVLEDASMRGTPAEWAAMAVDLYWAYQADRVVAEVNNGGEMIEALLRGLDRNVAYKAVRATRGKILRAEPAAALYEKGRVHHAGHFSLLEEQMCNYTGGVLEKSPDRLDALVWALTQLSGGNTGRVGSGDLALTY